MIGIGSFIAAEVSVRTEIIIIRTAVAKVLRAIQTELVFWRGQALQDAYVRVICFRVCYV